MTVVEDYQAATEQLASSTQREVRGIYLRIVATDRTDLNQLSVQCRTAIVWRSNLIER